MAGHQVQQAQTHCGRGCHAWVHEALQQLGQLLHPVQGVQLGLLGPELQQPHQGTLLAAEAPAQRVCDTGSVRDAWKSSTQ